jgi:hypothetical protein
MIANRMRAFAFAILESNSWSCLGIRLPQSLATLMRSFGCLRKERTIALGRNGVKEAWTSLTNPIELTKANAA